MNRTYKYRLYPTQKQAEQLDFLLWQGRKVYNGALAMRKEAYETTGETIGKYDLRDYWCEQRKLAPDTFGLLPANTVDVLIRRLDKAYKAFFRRVEVGAEASGFPRFKGRYHFNSLDYVYGKGCKLTPTGDDWAKLYIMNCGDIHVRFHRPLPEDAKIKCIVVRREKRDQWYASLQIELPDVQPEPSTKPAVGIDIGMVFLLALSDGTTIDNPRWYREAQQKRRVLQRKLDRQRRANNPQNYNEDGTAKSGVFIWRKSTRMLETERQLRKLDDHVAQQRWYFWHTITDWLTNTYGLIAIEDLTLDFMIENKRLAMSAYDASFSTLWQMLDYKAQERGVEVVRVPPQYTSQTCPDCGCIDRGNRKTQANFTCVECGYSENADLNAARNILRLALQGAVPVPQGETKASRSRVPRKA
jgi:putative transposase